MTLRLPLGPRIAVAPSCVAVLLALASDALAIPYIPPSSQVINRPLIIPSDGVLAVGTVDFNSGASSTQGELQSVVDANGVAISGVASQLTVPLGSDPASGSQIVSVWRPDVVFPVGSYAAIGLSADGVVQQPSMMFQVVPASDGGGTPLVTLTTQTLSAVQVAAASLPCGTTFGISAQPIPVNITTYYGVRPSVALEFQVDASDAVLSQHFFRAFRETSGVQYSPITVPNGVWSFSLQYPAGQAEYCVAANMLSLASGEVTDLGPFCVADDGTNWSAIVPATAAQFDAQLINCPTPPDEYKARQCALRIPQGVIPSGCEDYTQEELDAALDAPLDLGPVPDPMAPAPAVEPSADPIDPIDPVGSADPVGPVDSENPADPENSTDLVDPATSSEPAADPSSSPSSSGSPVEPSSDEDTPSGVAGVSGTSPEEMGGQNQGLSDDGSSQAGGCAITVRPRASRFGMLPLLLVVTTLARRRSRLLGKPR